MKSLHFGLAAIGLALLPIPAQADISARYETVDEDAFIDMEMTIEANDAGDVRIQMRGSSSYQLFHDGTVYSVSRTPHDLQVVRVADMMVLQQEAMARMGVDQEMFDRMRDVPTSQFAAMGEETVGDRTGTAFGMVSDEGAAPILSLLVISSDPQLAPIGQAIARIQTAALSNMGQFSIILSILNEPMSTLLEQGAPLRLMTIDLTDVSEQAIAPERFALPAEPLTLDQLRAGLTEFPPPPTLPTRIQAE